MSSNRARKNFFGKRQLVPSSSPEPEPSRDRSLKRPKDDPEASEPPGPAPRTSPMKNVGKKISSFFAPKAPPAPQPSRPPSTISRVSDTASQIDDIVEQVQALSTLPLDKQREAHQRIIGSLKTLKKDLPTPAGSTIALSQSSSISSFGDPNPSASATAILYPPNQRVKTSEYVCRCMWDLVTNLYQLSPDHPIFGPTESGSFRLPLREVGRNQLSWESKCRGIGRDVEKAMGPWILPGSCWMKKDPSIVISRKGDGVLAQCLIVRLLAFLTDPSPANYTYFTATSNETYDTAGKKIPATSSPFVHRCNNGHASVVKNAPGCVNGIEHGYFGTPSENYSYQKCSRDGGVTKCPGHGPRGIKCLYVHPDGIPKPCLNTPDGRPRQCSCPGPDCF